MKISILLPFKENFSPSYAGAVSLFINDTLKFSKFRKNLIKNIITLMLRKIFFQVKIKNTLKNLLK